MNYVGLRLMSVLDHLVGRVEGVTVRLADVEGPEGLIGKRCRMLARLTSSREVQVEGTAPGLYAAIDSAAEGLAHGVALDLLRRTTIARRHGSVLEGPGGPRRPASMVRAVR